MARLLPPDPAEVDIGIDVSGHGLKFLRFDAQYIEQLRELHNDSFVPDHPGASEVPAEAWARRFSDPTFADDLSFLMIATGTHEVVGYVLSNADQGRDDRVGGRDVRLSTITTRRGYRRRGVATAMIGLVLAEAVTLGYGRATLEVDTANPSGALRVYERAGFAVVDSATSYVRELL